MSAAAVRFHPVCEAFPLMDEDALGELTADIRANGLREPIWKHRGGAIIDGRNRYLACTRAGVQPRTRVYEGADSSLPAFVVSMNILRRHLDESQRAMVAAKLANLGDGQRADLKVGKSADLAPITQAKAAEMLNVGERTVREARFVQEHAEPDVVRAVECSEMSVHAAAKTVRRDSPEPAVKTRSAVTQRRDRMRLMADRGSTTEQIGAALGYKDRKAAAKALKRAGIKVHADRLVGRRRKLNSERIVDRIVSDAENLTAHTALIDFGALPSERIPAWLESLKAAGKSLGAFVRRLEARK